MINEYVFMVMALYLIFIAVAMKPSNVTTTIAFTLPCVIISTYMGWTSFYLMYIHP